MRDNHDSFRKEVKRCLPMNRQYEDWMRSEKQNGSFPKVLIYC